MKIVTAIAEMQALADALRTQGKTIGFVPTMGFLHEGHLSLMRRAREENDVVVTSIFVNPTQFGPQEDLDRYPRDAEGDAAKCSSTSVDILFLPAAAETFMKRAAAYRKVTFTGLMTMAPLVADPEEARPCFRGLRALRDHLSAQFAGRYELTELSMGMTNDYEVAVEEGATILRLGSALLSTL